jgi:hypothetical protein
MTRSSGSRQQEAERVASGVRSHVDSLAQEAGSELTDYDKEVIFRGAVGGDKIDAEVTAAAFKAHADYLKGLQEQYSRRRPTYLVPGRVRQLKSSRT